MRQADFTTPRAMAATPSTAATSAVQSNMRATDATGAGGNFSSVFRQVQGEVARFAKILPEYKAAPEITRERLYIETMEKVLSHTRKVLVNDKGGNLMVLPLDQMLKGGNASGAKTETNGANNLLRLPPASNSSSNASTAPTASQGDIMDQRRANAQRNDSQRQGE